MLLGLYGGSIASADQAHQAWCLDQWRLRSFSRDAIYEIALQSHLFLGFPRALQAAELLARQWPGQLPRPDDRAPELARWASDGEATARRVYGSVFERLTSAIQAVSPEIANWMVVDGYGKVLSRPGLEIKSREYAIVGMLIVDHRPVQLLSHVRGAIRVGCSSASLELIAKLLHAVSPGGSAEALLQIAKLSDSI